MAFKIPRPVWTQAIVDKAGLATKAFSRRIEEMLKYIETQVSSIVDLLAIIQAVQATQAEQLALILSTQATANAAQQAANQALTQADTGPSATARSDSAVDSETISGVAWVLGPTIALPTVSVGDLTITGSGPTGAVLNAGALVQGEYRIVELAGGSTIFTGSMSINASGVTNNDAAAVAAFTLPETTTGTVSYRMDVRRAGGTVGGDADVDFYFYVRRS